MGKVTHHFNQQQELLGRVDVKGFATCEIQSNLQIVLGEGKKLLFVHDDSLLNKAFTSTIIYLCSFVRFKSGYLGANLPIFQVSGHIATRDCIRGADKFGNLSVTTRVIGPKPAGIQAPEGSW